MISAIHQQPTWITLVAFLLIFPSFGMAAQPQALDLPEAQIRALAFSPRLAAADLGMKAASARHDQAGRRPNPNLQLDLENFAGSGESYTPEWTLSVSQVFDISGKRNLAKEHITQEISLLDWEQKAALLDLRQNVGLAFGAVWFAQETVALVHEQKELAIMMRDELANRLTAGGSSSVEVTRAQLHVAAAEVSLIHAQESLRTATHNLTSLWGSKIPDFQIVTLPSNFWGQTAAEMGTATIQNNPDINRWGSVLSLQNARLKLAEKANSLDLELALGMKYEESTGDRALVFGAGIPLPSSDRNQDEVRAIGYQLQQVQQLKLENSNNIEAQLAASVGSQTSALREMGIMMSEIIPLALQAYEETRLAHQQGLYSLTDVIATRNDLFDLRQTQLQSQLEFFNATVMISRLTGNDAMASNSDHPEEK